MSALFSEPIKARHVKGENPLLWIGVIDHPSNTLPPSPGRLLLCDADGGLFLGDIADIVIDWEYGVTADGTMGWKDKFYEGEAPPPELSGVDLEGLDDDA